MSDNKDVVEQFQDAIFALLTDKEIFEDGATEVEEGDDFNSLSEDDLDELLSNLGETDDKEDTSKFKDYELKIFEKYKMFIVKQFGGEGMGDDYYYVIKHNDKYIQIPGWYNSDAGSELQWEDMFEVEPKPVTRIEYLAVA